MSNIRVVRRPVGLHFFLCLLAAALVHQADAAPLKFAVFCDGRSGTTDDPGAAHGIRFGSIRALAAHAASQHVDLVIFPGDLSQGGTHFGSLTGQWTQWKKDMAPLYDAGIPVYPCRGNHETSQKDSVESWTNVFSYLPQNGPDGQKGLTYMVETNNACFIAFDQYVGRSPSYDRTKYDSNSNTGAVSPWVLDQIKRTTNRWVFAFGHEAAFIGHHTDCLANAPGERDALWDALGAKGGVYLCGHDHLYIRRQSPDSQNRPVLELVVGCAGGPPYPASNEALNAKYDRHEVPTDLFVNAAKPTVNTDNHPMYFGYVLVTVYPDRLEGEWWALTNYDTSDLAVSIPPSAPKFEKLDSFTWPAR